MERQLVNKDVDAMADVMNMPETYTEFIKEYAFKDRHETYTNGSDLIPVFRVEQMIEQYFKAKTTAKNIAVKESPSKINTRMSYEELIKTIRHCQETDCEQCSLSANSFCKQTILSSMEYGLDSLKAKNEVLQKEIEQYEEKCKHTPSSGYVIENGKVVFRSDVLGTYREEYDSLEDVVKTLNLYLHECYSFMEVNTHLRGTLARIQKYLDAALAKATDTNDVN